MQTVFTSKKDGWLVAIVGTALAVSVATGIGLLIQGYWEGLVPLGTLALIGSLIIPMRYVVSDDALVIRSGILRWRVPFAEIRSVTATRNPLSSPAWSLDRLEIRYRDGGSERSIMVSPQQREAFLARLAAAAPQARVELKQ